MSDLTPRICYELWKKDELPGLFDQLGDEAHTQWYIDWWNNMEALELLLRRLVKNWGRVYYWVDEDSYWSKDHLSRMSKTVLYITKKPFLLHAWARVHELFDKLGMNDKVRREYAKEVYWSNKKKK